MGFAQSWIGLGIFGALCAVSCGSTTSVPKGNAGSSSTAGATSGGGGSPTNGSGGGSTSGAAGQATTGGSTSADGGSAAGALSAGSGTGGADIGGGGSGTAGVGGAQLPSYAGPGVDCYMGLPKDEDNRCGVGQTCCKERFGSINCQPDIGSCAPCSEPGECTAISCDEPADCPGGACCATLGSGGGGVEFARLTCQPSCNEGQYVICATAADCPSEYTECGISSMVIRRCFH